MRILIIGGTGIISTGISRLLIQAGHEVVLYNRGQSPSQVEGDYTTMTGDRKDFATVDRLKKGQPIIVHGNGTSFWPTCHRDDVAVAFVGAIGRSRQRQTTGICLHSHRGTCAHGPQRGNVE